jgi:hypothetical protein
MDTDDFVRHASQLRCALSQAYLLFYVRDQCSDPVESTNLSDVGECSEGRVRCDEPLRTPPSPIPSPGGRKTVPTAFYPGREIEVGRLPSDSVLMLCMS